MEKGGDTDTTAAIVGGMIGAAEGYSKIPEKVKQKILTCDTSQSRYPRPDFLSPLKSDLLTLIEKLYKKRPGNDVKIN